MRGLRLLQGALASFGGADVVRRVELLYSALARENI